MKNMNKAILFASALFLSGCATTTGSNANDPLEGFNRTMFDFNDGLDRVALKPVATAYQKILPSFVQTGVNNFFGNIGDVWTMVNNFLQGKIEQGLSDGMRVAFNSTIGFGGVLDIASEAGLPKHKEDFGQTLGKWGVGAGPYVVLPLFGPSTVRDTAALPVDWAGDAWAYVTPVDVRNVGAVVRLVDQRATALNATNLLEDIALDRYTFIRGAYLQRREGQVTDGVESTKPGNTKPIGPQSDATPSISSDTAVAVDTAVEPQVLETVEILVNEPVALM